jgi:hypothetical protein
MIVGRDQFEASVRNFQVLPRAPQGEAHRLPKADGARILAPWLRHDVRGLEALIEEHGDLAVGAKAVLIRAMIDGAQVGHVRSWA